MNENSVEEFERLISESSLGTPEAVAIRKQAEASAVTRVLALCDERDKLPASTPAEQAAMKARLLAELELERLKAERCPGCSGRVKILDLPWGRSAHFVHVMGCSAGQPSGPAKESGR